MAMREWLRWLLWTKGETAPLSWVPGVKIALLYKERKRGLVKKAVVV